ncbi:OmpA family protein [Aureibaculum marinum]|uniref:OmpA family protein n=1 Tax=Aureibaculum marinum TaxID=2487930 RepID=A0A3N4N9N3_9FLAO|nr:OmpA family protein [Aureibaculum marinum]RPD93044.1 OmpA family protein [Aureibaculum marinum]
MIKFLTALLLIIFGLLNTRTVNSQTVDSSSKIIMSEADITSLIKTLNKYKKTNTQSNKSNETKPLTQSENFYKIEYLRQQLAQLEKQPTTIEVNRYSDSIVDLKIQTIQNEIAELKYLITNIKLNLATTNANTTNSEHPIFERNNTDKIIYIDRVSQPINRDTYTNSLKERDDKIRTLENKLSQLQSLLDNQKTTTTKKDEIKTVHTENPKKENKPNIQYTVDGTDYELKMAELTELSKTLKEQQLNASNTTYIDSIQRQLADLKNSMIAKDTLVTVTEQPLKKYDSLASDYANYRKQLFFKTNKKDLDLNQVASLDEIVSILANNDHIDVFIKGFASNSGNPVYNENLSLQRTESVKKILVAKGVHPTRILTQYHGIDYESKSNDKARRVDIDLLIRK